MVAVSREEPRRGVVTALPAELHPAVAEALGAAGIEALWSHQADVFEESRRGHTIVTTGTASGKSLAFNLPVLDTLAADPSARAHLPLSHQGARAGPGPQALGAGRAASCVTRSTTATRRARSAVRYAAART